MAEKSFKLSFVISAVDNVTYKVMEINERIAKATKPVRDLGTAFGNLARESGLTGLAANVVKTGDAARNLGRAFMDVGKVIAGVGLTAAAAFKFIVKDSFDSIDAIADASERVGVTTTTFQGLQYSAAQAGFELQNLEPILTRFSKNVGEAQKGTGDTAAVFQALGLSVQDLRNLSMDEILARTGTALSRIENPALRNAAAMKLFGKEGAKIVEVLADIPKAVKDAKAANLILGPEAFERAAKFEKTWGTMTLTLSRVRDVVGAELIPVFTDLFGKLIVWVNENRGQLVEWAKAFAQDLPRLINAFLPIAKALGSVLMALGNALVFITNILGPTGTAFLSTIVIAAKLIGPIVALASSIGGTLVSAFNVARTAFLLLLPLFKALWALLIANPIGLVVSAVAALAAGAYLVYKNWEPILDWFTKKWERIKELASSVGGFVGSIFGGDEAAQAGGGAGAGAMGPREIVQRQFSTTTNRSESKVVVDFSGVPRGTRVVTEKAEAPLDLSVGYALSTP